MDTQVVRKALKPYLDQLEKLNKYIYDNPELGHEELLASSAHIEILQEHGFEVERAPLDIETAYLASYESKKPGLTMAFLAEYDALPGIGHGCGHNLLGACSLGAALVLKDLVKEAGGKVLLFGTPAEETDGAKVDFAKAGYFDKVDLAICPHPSSSYSSSGKSLALVPLAFEFKGKTAHAASNPQAGINALDALLLTFNNINALREHLDPSVRIHGIVKEGGLAANIVPDRAVGEFYVRCQTMEQMEGLLEKVIDCARAGALATGASMNYYHYEAIYENMVTNKTLSDYYDGVLNQMGIKVQPSKESYGSLDMGNVSQACPSINPFFGISGKEIPGHTEAFAKATLTPRALKAMEDTIVAMVKTMLDVNKDKELYKAIRQEFEREEK